MPYKSRWTTVLQQQLNVTLARCGEHALVIPEGLCGRTTCVDDEHCWACCDGAPRGMNGRQFILPCLKTHQPVNVVVLALGCNDLKVRFNLSPKNIAA